MGAVVTLRNTTISKDEQILGVSNELEINEKDKFIQAQREKLTQASKSIKDLQVLLGDAGETIDTKNTEIDSLSEKVETFKFDKKNLLGIVQQLATIGNPAINLKSFMDKVDTEPTVITNKKVHKNKSARLVAQESQRSLKVIKEDQKKERKSKSFSFSDNVKSTKPLRRSFVDKPSSNSLNLLLVKDKNNSAEEEVVRTDYATKTNVDNIRPNSDDVHIKTLEQESASTTVTSLFEDFPSIIKMAHKITTAIPSLFTSTTTATTPTTSSLPSAATDVVTTEIFTAK